MCPTETKNRLHIPEREPNFYAGTPVDSVWTELASHESSLNRVGHGGVLESYRKSPAVTKQVRQSIVASLPHLSFLLVSRVIP